MKALLLNSGTGSRLGDLTIARPKCLVNVDSEETILSRQIKQLIKYNIKEFIVTIGPFENMIPDYISSLFPDINIIYVRNDVFDKTNYIYSMYLAEKYLDSDILLLHGDIIMEDEVLDILIKADNNHVVVDSSKSLPEKDFKGRIKDNNQITEISVNIHDNDCVFLLPVYKLSKVFMITWMKSIIDFVMENKTSVYAEEAFNKISDKVNLYSLNVPGKFCMEIDTEEDLRVAREYIKNEKQGNNRI